VHTFGREARPPGVVVLVDRQEDGLITKIREAGFVEEVEALNEGVLAAEGLD
jgi:hypothetical protein